MTDDISLAQIIVTALGFILIVGVIGAVMWDRNRMCIASIEGSLLRYHATDIKTRVNWMDSDRDTLTYDVWWRDREGKPHSNRCKVSSGYSTDDAVYWEEPLDRLHG